MRQSEPSFHVSLLTIVCFTVVDNPRKRRRGRFDGSYAEVGPETISSEGEEVEDLEDLEEELDSELSDVTDGWTGEISQSEEDEDFVDDESDVEDGGEDSSDEEVVIAAKATDTS